MYGDLKIFLQVEIVIHTGRCKHLRQDFVGLFIQGSEGIVQVSISGT